jgi:hypothetical protein
VSKRRQSNGNQGKPEINTFHCTQKRAYHVQTTEKRATNHNSITHKHEHYTSPNIGTSAITNPAAGNGRATNTRQHYRGRRTTTNSFTPKISKIESLASSSENKSQDFSKFQKSLHHHVLTTFKNSKDLSTAILEFADPLVAIRQHTPSLTEIRTRHNLGLQGPTANETEAAKFTRESRNSDSTDTAKIIFSNEIKLVAERECDAVYKTLLFFGQPSSVNALQRYKRKYKVSPIMGPDQSFLTVYGYSKLSRKSPQV